MAKTQNSFHILMVSLCFVLLINNVKSDSLSLRFPNFAPRQNSNIGFLGDERPLDGAIQLRRRDNNGPYLMALPIFAYPVLVVQFIFHKCTFGTKPQANSQT